MDWKAHGYRAGSHTHEIDALPVDPTELDDFTAAARKNIEPWLSAVFQAEHLNLLVGSGFTTAIASKAGSAATGMSTVTFGSAYDVAINAHAAAGAKAMNRGAANVEDQFRSALAVLEGLKVTDAVAAATLKTAMDAQMLAFLKSLLATERGIAEAGADKKAEAEAFLQSFLLSFASRAASRERLHVFTTNYDRLIEHGADLAGLRIVDRFVGALSPIFRSSRIEVDLHYNPPGIRGEPRFMEGVVRLTKLHGSLDWRFDPSIGAIRKFAVPFGAPDTHTDLPTNTLDTVMIYPNPAKDVETTAYPYAELFRDMAAALCRPNAVVVAYGYGFGDDHINRVLVDMLAIPSTHLVIITYGVDDRIKNFCARTRAAQVSLLIGPHFASLDNLVEYYLPKPALDYVTGRLTELLKHRPSPPPPTPVLPAGGAAP
jgi:hypothetical protein